VCAVNPPAKTSGDFLTGQAVTVIAMLKASKDRGFVCYYLV